MKGMSFMFALGEAGRTECQIIIPGEGLDHWGKVNKIYEYLSEHGNFHKMPTGNESEKKFFSEVSNFISERKVTPAGQFDNRDPFGFGFWFIIK